MAPLSVEAANKLVSSPAFFYVTPVPAAAKFSPGVFLSLAGDSSVRLAEEAFVVGPRGGLRVHLRQGLTTEERSGLVAEWGATRFGLDGNHVHKFSAMASEFGTLAWRDVAAAAADCSSTVAPQIAESSPTGPLRMGFNRIGSNEELHTKCAAAALAYLASYPDVAAISLAPTFKPLATSSERAEWVGGGGAVAALQADSYWNIGIDGSSEFIQVTDTGFDDASCLLRTYAPTPVPVLQPSPAPTKQPLFPPSQRPSRIPTYVPSLEPTEQPTVTVERRRDLLSAEIYLTGSFNPDWQVERSFASSPITDLNKRKVVQYVSVAAGSEYAQDAYMGHGTHVASVVAGSIDVADSSVVTGFSYNFTEPLSFSGLAPGSRLMVFDFGDDEQNLAVPDNLNTEVFTPAYDAGARIITNSWGSTPESTFYDFGVTTMDEFIYENDDVLVLVAAGDRGNGGGSSTINSPAVSKNCIAVGAAETAEEPDTVAFFSSRGPTNDYRIKPDVVGPGNPIWAAKASGEAGMATCAVTEMSGTSTATPAVAGAAALLRHFLVSGKHEDYSPAGFAASSYISSNPSSALLKSLLIGSTRALSAGYDSHGNTVLLNSFYGVPGAVADPTAYLLGTPGVDFHQGFGHVQLAKAFSLDSSFETFLYEPMLSNYSSWERTFVVTSTVSDVTLTLAWNDPPGTLGCGMGSDSCLIHDLDLEVYWGGTRRYANFGAATSGTHRDEEDVTNNVEKVTFSASELSVGDAVVVFVKTNGLSYADSQKFAFAAIGPLRVACDGCMPTLVPSPSPTVEPTSVDGFTASGTFDLTASTEPTLFDKSRLLSSVGAAIGVDDSEFKNFEVSSVQTSRRVRRGLLATYTWSASFTVSTTLSNVGAVDPQVFKNSMTANLVAASFSQLVLSAVGAVVDTATILTSVATRNPSPSPTLVPSSSPTALATFPPTKAPGVFPPTPAPSVTPAPTALPTQQPTLYRCEGADHWKCWGTVSAASAFIIIFVLVCYLAGYCRERGTEPKRSTWKSYLKKQAGESSDEESDEEAHKGSLEEEEAKDESRGRHFFEDVAAMNAGGSGADSQVGRDGSSAQVPRKSDDSVGHDGGLEMAPRSARSSSHESHEYAGELAQAKVTAAPIKSPRKKKSAPPTTTPMAPDKAPPKVAPEHRLIGGPKAASKTLAPAESNEASLGGMLAFAIPDALPQLDMGWLAPSAEPKPKNKFKPKPAEKVSGTTI